MTSQTIVSTDVLARHLDDPQWVVLDCRFVLKQPEEGRGQYRQGHIGKAYYGDLNRDFSSSQTEDSGRHPLPDVKELEGKLRRWGVNGDSQVVVYDDANSSLAVRAWWVLRWLGHKNIAVLDGGLGKWLEETREIQTGETPPPASVGNFNAKPNDDMWVDTETVLAGLGGDDRVIIDARAPERYSGEGETMDAEGGHIPTAINRPLAQNLDADHCFLPADELKRIFSSLQQPVTIHSCGSGVTACHNILAMEIAGLSGSLLYVGSWSEWIRAAQRPSAQGKEPGVYQVP